MAVHEHRGGVSVQWTHLSSNIMVTLCPQLAVRRALFITMHVAVCGGLFWGAGAVGGNALSFPDNDPWGTALLLCLPHSLPLFSLGVLLHLFLLSPPQLGNQCFGRGLGVGGSHRQAGVMLCFLGLQPSSLTKTSTSCVFQCFAFFFVSLFLFELVAFSKLRGSPAPAARTSQSQAGSL